MRGRFRSPAPKAVLAANYFDPLALPLVAGSLPPPRRRVTPFVTAFVARVAPVLTALAPVVTSLHSGGLGLRVRSRQHHGWDGEAQRG